MRITTLLLVVAIAFTLPSCVSKKKFTGLQDEQNKTQMALDEAMQRIEELQKSRTEDNDRLNGTIREKENEIALITSQRDALQAQVTTLQNTSDKLLDQLQASQIANQAEARSIAASLEKINSQSDYIERLNKVIRVKDSTNVALVYNLKKSLADLNDEDIDVEVRGTKVFVSISDKLLFKSGQARIGSQAGEILEKVAKVIKDNGNLDVTVEGHTDDVPISSPKFADNWELSTARATAVVKALTKKYEVDPGRLSAAGRGEFSPKADNETPEGRAMNRRTEIILTPKLDQFFKLLEAPTDIPAQD